MSQPAQSAPTDLYPGRRFAQIVKLKPEHLDEYRKCHAAVWPQVLDQIKECNIADCASLTALRACPGQEQ